MKKIKNIILVPGSIFRQFRSVCTEDKLLPLRPDITLPNNTSRSLTKDH